MPATVSVAARTCAALVAAFVAEADAGTGQCLYKSVQKRTYVNSTTPAGTRCRRCRRRGPKVTSGRRPQDSQEEEEEEEELCLRLETHERVQTNEANPPFYFIWLHACHLPGLLPRSERVPFRSLW